jgi:hypothetical protein
MAISSVLSKLVICLWMAPTDRYVSQMFGCSAGLGWLQLPALITGFFEELALGRYSRSAVFRVDHSARHFQSYSADTMTELFNHNDFAVFGDGNDIYPVGGPDDVKRMRIVALMRDAARNMPVNRKNAAVGNEVGGQRFPVTDRVGDNGLGDALGKGSSHTNFLINFFHALIIVALARFLLKENTRRRCVNRAGIKL